MRVFVTGGSGELGRPVLAGLVAEGHRVCASVRSGAAARIVGALGATPASTNLLDRDAVRSAVADADADAVLHLATAIPPSAQMGNLSTWVANDRLRAETTRDLADAAAESGAALVLQSYFGVAAPRGDDWIDESPDREPRWSTIGVMDSMRAAEETAAAVGAIILRFGSLYSESSEQLQAQIGLLEAGVAAIPGDGTNYWPYIATDDAGRAVLAAVGLAAGTYDVSDDDPTTLEEFWTMAAATVGTPVPPKASVDGHPMAPILLGSWRTSNRAFREATGWAPRTASVHDGWPAAVERFRATRPGLRPG